MKNVFRTLIAIILLSTILLTGSSAFGQISLGIRIGPPPPPRVAKVQPRRPGPDYLWVDGYWYPEGKRYKWHEGYWTRPPYPGAHWVGPRHDGQQFFPGYWDGDRGRFEHDHHSDRDHNNRDFRDDHR